MIYGTLLKSPYLWHLIYGSQKTPFFHIFDVSGPSGHQMNRGKMHNHYFFGRKLWEKEPEERSHEGRIGMAHAANESGRVGPTHSHLGPRFDLPF
jgi:hypothetical protein